MSSRPISGHTPFPTDHFQSPVGPGRTGGPNGRDADDFIKFESPFISFLKRIWNLIKSLFKKIGDFFKKLFMKKESSFHLADHEIKILNKTGFDKFAKKPDLTPPSINKTVSYLEGLLDLEDLKRIKKGKCESKSKPQNSLSGDLAGEGLGLDASINFNKKLKGSTLLFPIKNPVMKDFHETSMKFLESILDCVLEEKINPVLSDVKKGLSAVSDTLKFVADLAVKFGDKAAKPVFEKLKKFSIDENSEFQSLIKWLTKEGIPEDFASKLKDSVSKEFSKDPSFNLDKFIVPCIQWISGDHSKSIQEYYKNAGISETGTLDNINKVYEASIFLLLERKIIQFISKCSEKLEGKLPAIMRQMIVENGKKIGDVLIHRMIEVFDSTEFPILFDDLVRKGFKQTELIIEVEKAKDKAENEHKALLDKAKKVKNLNPETPEETITKFNLVSHLQNAETMGEGEWIKKQVEEAGMEAFLKSSFCSPKIANLIQNSNLNVTEKNKLEEELFDKLAEEAISIFLPSRKVLLPSGEIKEVDGFLYLCSLIEIPQEFKDIAEEAVNISKEILTPSSQKVIKGVYETVWNIAGDHIQETILNEVKNLIKKGIKVGVTKMFDKIIASQSIDSLVSDNILPMFQNQMIIHQLESIIDGNRSTYSKFFHELITLDMKSPERETLLEKISSSMYPELKKLMNSASADINELGYEKLKKLFLTDLSFIENEIRLYQTNNNDHSLKSVQNALQDYFCPKKEGASNPVYGELSMNLLFKIGKFSNTAEFFSDFFKSTISQLLTQKMKYYKKSPDALIDMATQGIKTYSSDKATLKKLIFDKSIEPTKAQIETKLLGEMKKTARITLDIINSKVKNLSWSKKMIVVPTVKLIIGTNENKLTNLISDIYNKTFGNQIMTQNFILKCQDVILGFLSNACKKIEEKSALKPITVTKMPSLIPAIF